MKTLANGRSDFSGVTSGAANRFGDRAVAAVAVAQRELAERIAERARELCPVDTGATRDAIEVRQHADGQYTVGVHRDHPAKRAHVAKFLEFGTVKMAARPFMQPAAEQVRAEAAGLVADAVTQALRHG